MDSFCLTFELESAGGNERLQLAPKLTAAHIYLQGFKTMSVRLAAQLMSHSCAAGNLNLYLILWL